MGLRGSNCQGGAKRRAHGAAWLRLPGLKFAKLVSATKIAEHRFFNGLGSCDTWLRNGVAK